MKQDYPETLTLKPIGYVSTDAREVPRFYTVSDIRGSIVFNEEYTSGLSGISAGDRLYVLFYFHDSPPFNMDRQIVTPPHGREPRGVFNSRSPVRPNPLGLSILEVLEVRDNVLEVTGLDMLDGTPVLDIKPVDSNRSH